MCIDEPAWMWESRCEIEKNMRILVWNRKGAESGLIIQSSCLWMWLDGPWRSWSTLIFEHTSKRSSKNGSEILLCLQLLRDQISTNLTCQDLRSVVFAWWEAAAKLKKQISQIILLFGCGMKLKELTWQLGEANLLLLQEGLSTVTVVWLFSRWFIVPHLGYY